jgi:cyclopropane-fatty-acyl-phospholipid synthase
LSARIDLVDPAAMISTSARAPASRGAAAEEKLFASLFDRALEDVRVRFQFGDHAVEAGRGELLELQVSDPAFFRRALAEGNLGLAESYMAGGWEVVGGGRVEHFLAALLRNRVDESLRLDPIALSKMALLRARQMLSGTAANVQAHYDVGDELYAAFLDESRGYTCGYQLTPEDTSEDLQRNKYDRVCKKLRLADGETLFDIGCGFGGLLIHAARRYGVTARGITNSRLHAAFAQKRVRELGLAGKVQVDLGDMREAQGAYDKVVSCGLMEHLLPREHKDFVALYRRLLKAGGLGLIHTLGCVTPSNQHDPFIQKHIFPGSTQNPLSTISRAVERQRLAILDAENLARHYLPTARRWLEAFRKNRPALDPQRYPERFCRTWEYYLALCVAAAEFSDGAAWQVLFAKDYRRPRPLHRV